jgi:hypothetical protein
MPKKIVPIKYTSREYETIRQDLIEYVKRYYPEIFRDFNEASFGALMLDTVAYVGDILSFYLDYQANESFLDTAVEYDNILKLGRQLGYHFKGNPSSYGIATFYILCPTDSTGMAPDMRYLPILKKKSQFSATSGAVYMLDEDVHFDHPHCEIRVARADTATGIPTAYAVKAFGRVISGQLVQDYIQVGDFKKFRTVEINQENVAEIIEVIDDEGHEYIEVEYLSQDVVYRALTNRNSDKYDAPEILKPFMAPRRFVTERSARNTILQFGASSDIEVDINNVVNPSVVDPANVVLQRHGAPYISDASFDPYRLIESDKFGIAPSQTTLSIVYRLNSVSNVNAQTGTLTEVVEPLFEFKDRQDLSTKDVKSVRASLEVINEEPIVGDVTLPSGVELKRRILDTFATQNRAVTAKDYAAMAYSMPPRFGALKRVAVMRDHDSLKRNLNMYVISEDGATKLTETNDTIKKNLKTWLLKNKMVNDTIDILPAKIINAGIEWAGVGRLDMNKYDVLVEANKALSLHFSRKLDIGEPFWITDVYKVLKSVTGIVDVTRVDINQKNGGRYSDIRIDLNDRMSADGRYINTPKNCIFEVKYPTEDIKGVIT